MFYSRSTFWKLSLPQAFSENKLHLRTTVTLLTALNLLIGYMIRGLVLFLCVSLDVH